VTKLFGTPELLKQISHECYRVTAVVSICDHEMCSGKYPKIGCQALIAVL